MAITVQYQPPMDLLSRAGYVAGAGQFAQRQQQLALAQQEADANRRLREQQLMLAAQDQAFGQQRAMQNDAVRQQQIQAELQNRALAEQNDMVLGQQRNQAYLKQLEQTNPELAREAVWQRDTAQALDKQVNEQRAAMSKLPLTPEGKAVASKLTGSLREIQARRHQLRPSQYAELVGKWLDDVHNSSIESYVEPPPTPAQRFSEEVFVEPQTGIMIGFDDNGRKQFYDPKKQESAAKKQAGLRVTEETTGRPLSFREYLIANAESPDFEKKKQAKWKELLDASKAKTLDPTKVTAPTEADVFNALEREHNEMLKRIKEQKKAPLIDPRSMGVDLNQGVGAYSPASALANQPEPISAHWVVDEQGNMSRVK